MVLEATAMHLNTMRKPVFHSQSSWEPSHLRAQVSRNLTVQSCAFKNWFDLSLRADVFDYIEGDMVIDPKLSEHLAHWGIDMHKMEKVSSSNPKLALEGAELLSADGKNYSRARVGLAVFLRLEQNSRARQDSQPSLWAWIHGHSELGQQLLYVLCYAGYLCLA